MKIYRSARELLAEVKRLLATNKPSAHHSPLVDIIELLCQGRFLLNGFRNKDLRPHLPGPPNANQRQASARISRKLQLLRAHGLIFKVPKTHYHRITKKGHDVMATAIKFRVSDIALLAA